MAFVSPSDPIDRSPKFYAAKPPANVIRSADEDDFDAIINMCDLYLGRNPGEELRDLLRLWPGIVAYQGDELVGFAYSEPAGTRDVLFDELTPLPTDVVTLRNILVSPRIQSGGVGGAVLSAFEQRAAQYGFQAVVLSNSMLHTNRVEKRSAVPFYLQNGYDVILSTDDTTTTRSTFLSKRIQGVEPELSTALDTP